ncbi:MAG: response regulator [Candidatus Omnitrophica bacterium]|nr:response regulator [Candidatus Omnitrophota bacterium]
MEDQVIRVLLVEDSDTEANIVCECLKASRFGRFEVTRVGMMSLALEFLKNNECDVVVLDLGLPDSQRLETLLTIEPLTEKAGIVVLTSSDIEVLATTALKHGAQDYQIKAEINEKEFPRVVRYAFERKMLENELRKKSKELEAQVWGMAKTNDSIKILYKELEKKNAQVEARAKELKVFYDASVGREERILELKKEVEKLKRELESHKKS